MSIYKWTEHIIIEALNIHVDTVDRVTLQLAVNWIAQVQFPVTVLEFHYHIKNYFKHSITFGELSTLDVTKQPTILASFSQFTSTAPHNVCVVSEGIIFPLSFSYWLLYQT